MYKILEYAVLIWSHFQVNSKENQAQAFLLQNYRLWQIQSEHQKMEADVLPTYVLFLSYCLFSETST
jgi:hypothetical protein